MSTNVKQTTGILLGAVLSAMLVQYAGAEMLDGMMDRLTSQITSVSKFAVGIMFVIGIILGGLSIVKFKEHSDNPGQSKLSKPMGYLIAAAALIGIPSYLAIFTNTLTGEGHESSNSTGSSYNSIR